MIVYILSKSHTIPRLLQWITIPFALVHEAVGSLRLNETDWLGSISEDTPWVWGEWTDFAVLLIFGGIPWQVRGKDGEEQEGGGSGGGGDDDY